MANKELMEINMGEFTIKAKGSFQPRAGDVAAMVARELGLQIISLEGRITSEEPERPIIVVKHKATDLHPTATIIYDGAPSKNQYDIIYGRGNEFTISRDLVTKDVVGRVEKQL